ncbi:MAG: dihydrolipoamide acetyltransferase family protein [Dehalococcoidia bacterium]
MATITMPQLGESVTEGTILRWMKQPGDPVALDEPLCEIETEKVTAELPSPHEGVMGRIIAAEGATVPVGSALCEVEESAVSSPPPAPAPAAQGGWTGGPMAIPPERPTHAAPVPAAAVAAPARPPEQPAEASSRGGFISPAVARIAHERGVDPAQVTGTGLGGRVTRRDVERWAAPQAPPRAAIAERVTPTPSRETAGRTLVTLSPTRRTIAANLTRSSQEIPQAWTMVEVDVTALVARRQAERAAFEAEHGVPLTLLPYFIAAVCGALQAEPGLNARWEGGELYRYHTVHAGVAVAAENGLVVPVIRDAGDLTVGGLAKALAGLIERARTRRLRVEDIEGGTITMNNTGAFGSIASRPLVNPPQVGIVTMERAVRRVVVRDDGSFAIRSMMNVCLSFDHRAFDGAEAGAFLAALKDGLEGTGVGPHDAP